MKSFAGKFTSGRGWALFLALLLGAGLMISACGEEEVPAPTTPAPPPTPPPTPEPEPEPEPPATPTGLMVSGSTESSITWTWTAVDGATGYVVQSNMDEMWNDTDTVTFNGVGFTTETTYTATDLEAETTVYVRVAARAGTADAPLVSDFSTHVTGRTTAVPLAPAPANLRVKDSGHNYIVWEWDPVEEASGYRSQFSDSETFPTGSVGLEVHPGMNSTTRRVANRTPESDGYLRVQIYTGTVSDPTYGMWSASSPAMTTEAPPPMPLRAPGNLDVSNETTDSLTVSWDEVDNADISEVEFRVAGAGGNWNDADCGDSGSNVVDGTSCVVSDLDEGTGYEFRVRAVPESGSTEQTESDWAEAEGATVGAQEPTVSGGMGDLNVTWTSTADTITFSWEPMAGTTYEWQQIGSDSATRLAALDSANPCAAADFFDSPLGTGANFSYRFESVTADDSSGGIRGLCVRIDDDDLDADEKALSFAWGAVPPRSPAATDTPTVNERRVATALDWQTVDVKKGFEWELRLVADSGRGDGDLDGTPGPAVQAACAAGTFVDQGDADLNLTINYTWDGAISPYTGYLLCLKYANTAGATAWAVPVENGSIDEIYTPPAAPPSPRYESSRSSTTGTDRTLVWTVPVRNSTNVPRESRGFEAKIIHYPVRYDHDGDDTNNDVPTPAPRSCESDDISGGPSNLSGGDNPWDATTTATPTNDLDGITVTSGAIGIPANDAYNLGVRLCVRATRGSPGGDTANNGPWIMGGSATITKQPAP